MTGPHEAVGGPTPNEEAAHPALHETAGSPGAAATLTADDNADGGPLHWQVHETAPGNPFTSQLVFTDNAGPLLWLDLDPLTLQTLTRALHDVTDAQSTALTGQPATQGTPAPQIAGLATGPANTSPTSTGDASPDAPSPAAAPGWLARHKILAGLVTLVALACLYTFITGGAHM